MKPRKGQLAQALRVAVFEKLRRELGRTPTLLEVQEEYNKLYGMKK